MRRPFKDLTDHELYLQSREICLRDRLGRTNEIRFRDLFEECEARGKVETIWRDALYDATEVAESILDQLEGVAVAIGFVNRIDYMNEMELRRTLRMEDVYKAEVKGKSMHPTLKHGDIIYYRETENFKDNDIVIVNLEGKPLIKRWMHSHDGYRLLSDNPNYSEMLIPFDCQLIRIGVVTEVRRNL